MHVVIFLEGRVGLGRGVGWVGVGFGRGGYGWDRGMVRVR